ncbi:acyltransferase family protein [Paraburkholderia acidiphila]|uniref:Acyltransferase family protein n=1 Tax=Paraburkholderia acidiphila TaxID=2571747 RepID=A0A7Z2J8W1_9BURK|nr:acyltransferase [Paraburkholderia acidiphila]QGZ54849.1 acyltransferase family protein [Paraburkholderia acidiphila]
MAKKNIDIECLRAVAILLTALQHLNVLFRWSPHPLGRIEDYLHFWGGVDLFFCISGYVVSKSLIESLDVARGEGREWLVVKAFWTRRVYRLLPSAWLWMIIMGAGTFLFNETGAFGNVHDTISRSIAIVTGVANFATFFGINMGQGFVYWSLALEEQFYLIFPFFVVFVPIAWRHRVLLLAIAIQFPMYRSTGTIFWATRLDALLWGIVLYLFSRTPQYRIFEPLSLKKSSKAWGVSLFLIFTLAAIPGALETVPFHVGMMALASAALVYAASFNKAYVLPSRWLRPILTWIGSRSYAIYLCHLPAYMITHELWTRWTERFGLSHPNGTYTIRYAITALALITALAELNYRLVEAPLRKRGMNAARRITLQPSAASDQMTVSRP